MEITTQCKVVIENDGVTVIPVFTPEQRRLFSKYRDVKCVLPSDEERNLTHEEVTQYLGSLNSSFDPNAALEHLERTRQSGLLYSNKIWMQYMVLKQLLK